jgi:protein O-mannosyl-transferase
LIIVATCVAYSPAMHGGFIWDDNDLLVNNKLIHAPDGLIRLWFTTEPVDYWPVTYSSFWLEWRLWGTNSTGYHITNVVLHIASALLLWRILAKLSIPGAYLATLLFAVHPVNIESVAWIAQRKNTMAMFFFLLSIHLYLKADERPAALTDNAGGAEQGSRPHLAGLGRRYWLSLLAFAFAMLSKGSVAILPLALLLIVWWQRRHITRWDLIRCGPFFVLAIALTAVNVWFQTHGTGEAIRSASFVQRIAGAAAAVWFYLAKALLPINLLFVYPQWQINASDWLWWLPLLAAVAVAAMLMWKRNTYWGHALLFGWGLFCVALLPVLGFADVYFMKYSLVADHYQYIAVIGIVALAAALWENWRVRASRPIRALAPIVAATVAGAFVLQAWRQSATYSDGITLYQTTLARNPSCWMAHNNLGLELDRLGQIHDAIEQYEQTVLLNPNDAEAHNNLGGSLLQTGQSQEAIEHFQEALRIKPNYAVAHNNLGVALARLGQPQGAIEHFQEALRFKPDYAEAHYNLGVALSQIGQPQEAIEHFQEALRIKPDYAEAHNNLAVALVNIDRPQEAIEHYQQAIRLKPDYAEAHNNLGNVLSQIGRPQEAIEHYQQAIRLNPDFAEANYNLALVNAQMHRFEDATRAVQRAIDIAESHGQTALAERMKAWLNSYRAKQSSSPTGSAILEAPSPQK